MSSYKGKFKPKYPDKYAGDSTGIIYRSLLELKFFRFCDTNPQIKKWASEELSIPYLSPKDNRVHRYFPDVIVEKNSLFEEAEIIMIEIKPSAQCGPPKMGGTKKAKRRFLRESMTWGVNSAKWEAAKNYCEDKGWRWLIMTEKDLGVTYSNKKKNKAVRLG